MQRHARGFIVRLRKRREKAATRLQACTIAFIVRQHLKVKRAAAIKIQTRARGNKSRKRVGNLKDDYQKASETTQRAYRGHKGRQKAKQMKEEKMIAEQEEASALAIQKIHRGKADRVEVEKKRKEKQERDRYFG